VNELRGVKMKIFVESSLLLREK